MSEPAGFALALHGGAGPRRPSAADDARVAAHLRGLVEAARDRLAAGAAALDVVVETIAGLEASGLYVAGRGAAVNTAGGYELDASLMDAVTGAAGAVAALAGFESPIRAARAVMEASGHVFLVGEGAAAFAREQGLAEIADPQTWFTRVAETIAPRLASGPQGAHGTVGCVVRDAEGRLAAGTSTGGVFGKLPGRVGDTPVIGAGTWADARVAVSCTGQGEFFLRTVAAAQVAMRMRLAGASLAQATRAVLDEIAALGGEGGLIALSADGRLSMPFTTACMHRAALHPDGRITVEAV